GFAVERMRGEGSPEAEAARYGALLRQRLPLDGEGWPVFDCLLLGMGEDGHIGSIFPAEMERAEVWSEVCLATRAPDGNRRISLSLEVIKRATECVLLATGAVKGALLGRLLQGEAAVQALPVGILGRRERVSWYLDEAAGVAMEQAFREGRGA
ncbi:MAG: 6-phosphogluconolactonase, partial [Magnetococcales bacterium]|nr:6-phosphogluconolactonase [Magnetococcales bacterium]